MSTKEEASPSRKTEKCMCNKNFLDSKELIPEEEDSEEDIEEMANSLADLKVEEEDNDDDSSLNSEEVRVDEDSNVHEVDIVEKEVLVTVNASEVDPLETGEDIIEKSDRKKKLEKLKGRR